MRGPSNGTALRPTRAKLHLRTRTDANLITPSLVLFYVTGALTIGGALVVVMSRNIVYAAFGLLASMVGVAGLFLLAAGRVSGAGAAAHLWGRGGHRHPVRADAHANRGLREPVRPSAVARRADSRDSRIRRDSGDHRGHCRAGDGASQPEFYRPWKRALHRVGGGVRGGVAGCCWWRSSARW